MRLKDQICHHKFSLMVSLPSNNIELAQAALEAGANILKVHCNCFHFASGSYFRSWEKERDVITQIVSLAQTFQVPVGIVTGESTQPTPQERESMRKDAQLDFFDLFSRFCPAHYLQWQSMQKMIAIDSSWTPAMLTAFEGLGVDVIESSVVDKTNYGSPLTLHDLSVYRRIAQSTTLPIMVPSQKNICVEDIESLAMTGVSGVTLGAIVTGLDTKSMQQSVQQFRKGIDQTL